MFRSRRPPLIVALALLPGCMTWKRNPMAAGSPPALSGERPVRVSRTDGSVVVLEQPRIMGDSLVGDLGSPPQRYAVAWRDIQQVDERGVSVARTSGAVLGVGAVLLGVTAVLTFLYVMRMYSGS